jgi:type IV pilus assembly protein PilX
VRDQRGAVLFVATIILLVLSLLAVAMAKSAVVESRIAGAARNAQLAQLAADSAMNEARAKIARVAASGGAKAVCVSMHCAQREADAPADPAAYMRTSSARAAAIPFRIDLTRAENTDATAQLVVSPVYVVEDLGTAPPVPGAVSPSRHLFRVTAKGVGASEDFTRVIESIHAVAESAAPAS